MVNVYALKFEERMESDIKKFSEDCSTSQLTKILLMNYQAYISSIIKEEFISNDDKIELIQHIDQLYDAYFEKITS